MNYQRELSGTTFLYVMFLLCSFHVRTLSSMLATYWFQTLSACSSCYCKRDRLFLDSSGGQRKGRG